jgi:hypothetical protein
MLSYMVPGIVAVDRLKEVYLMGGSTWDFPGNLVVH